jgi:hypothetical protein
LPLALAFSIYNKQLYLDGKKNKIQHDCDSMTSLLEGLFPGIQDCKNPGSLGKTWDHLDQAKSLKFILIDSNFLMYPVLRHLPTRGVSPLFEEFFFFQKNLFRRTPSRDSHRGTYEKVFYYEYFYFIMNQESES